MNVSVSSACPAVLLIIFNRPDKTRQVMEAIRKAHPPRLYIAADGPRAGCAGEVEACEAARMVAMKIDWPCEISTLFRETNLGCKLGESTAMDWFFEHESEGIILEDDTLPHPSFFRFCEELLARYRHDERIAMIGGVNAQFGRKRTDDSYYFSRFSQTWGWASWRRAWKIYDVNLSLWPEVRDGGWLEDILGDAKQVKYWRNIFESVLDGSIDTWDYQWIFACWINSELAILPNVNLISNIGFGPDATNTTGVSRLANMEVKDIDFPLKHPKMVVRDAGADAFSAKEQYMGASLIKRLISRVKMVGG